MIEKKVRMFPSRKLERYFITPGAEKPQPQAVQCSSEKPPILARSRSSQMAPMRTSRRSRYPMFVAGVIVS